MPYLKGNSYLFLISDRLVISQKFTTSCDVAHINFISRRFHEFRMFVNNKYNIFRYEYRIKLGDKDMEYFRHDYEYYNESSFDNNVFEIPSG